MSVAVKIDTLKTRDRGINPYLLQFFEDFKGDVKNHYCCCAHLVLHWYIYIIVALDRTYSVGTSLSNKKKKKKKKKKCFRRYLKKGCQPRHTVVNLWTSRISHGLPAHQIA